MILIEKDKEEIKYLYFEKMYSYSMLMQHFNGKYTYAELKTFIAKTIKGED